jgi:hypothetical protein
MEQRTTCHARAQSAATEARDKSLFIGEMPYFAEDIRAQLKQTKESRRRGIPAGTIDWNSICGKLEYAARLRDQGVELLVGCDLHPREVLDELVKCRKAVDRLLRNIQKPQLLAWHIISEDRVSIRSNSPKEFHLLVENLVWYRDELAADIEHLQELTRGRRTRTSTLPDCDRQFLKMVLDIGHELFGPEIGDEDGPFIKFISLAAKPVLGQSTPPLGTLRTIARRV